MQAKAMVDNVSSTTAQKAGAAGLRPPAMELKQLSYFLGVAEAGSFSKAAVRLSVDQPMLSRHVKLLENELGVELLYRNGRGVVLSEAGKLLEAYARSVVDLVGQAQSEISTLRSEPRGRVAIAMPPSIGWMLTGPLVLRCREAFPNILLHMAEGFSGHVAEWLSTGRIDIGIVYQAPRRPSLTTEPLFTDELILLGPIDDPAGLGGETVPAAKIAEIPMILPARPHGLRVLIDHELEKLGLSAMVEFEVDAMPSTLSLVERGIGYTVLSEGAVTHLIGAGRIRRWSLTEPTLWRELLLATSTQRPMSVATRLVARLIRDEVHSILRGKS
ncbi:LysR substrate-binding domain-containing protein [Labrys wisconsinensis]|uniref:LysR family nitrogen assimilation transcriptional regulator n=1 Tax=Labrys wisconsinensis TaxID=425677 RepID=A0ABU0JG11_9HYPH|nr:LysR substrate-binding domain-containing protein [Labrys wisconsinensis]MDQ0473232.1 LysR family nitrogen assimilation transcriptional regulator [Labrys wisconsinensis]